MNGVWPIARKLAANIRRAADGDFPPDRRPYEDPVKGQEWVERHRCLLARCNCEQAHHQLKDELDLDHCEGRSWLGLHHHALLTMMAFTYLQHRRLASHSQAGKNSSQCAGSATPAITAGSTPRDSCRAASRDSHPVS